MNRYLALLSVVILTLSSCGTALRMWEYGVPDVYDYQVFQSRMIPASSKPFHFVNNGNVQLPPADLWACETKVAPGCTPEEFLEKSNTLALIVIRKDTVLYENYFNGHSRESVSQLFSVTKSFMSTLVGMAMYDGVIKSLDQPVSDFIPSFAEGEKAKVTLQHLLNMTSGINFADYQNLGKLVTLYYAGDQDGFVDRVKIKHEPGTHFAYSSLSTYILGVCLEKATGIATPEYMRTKIWEPLGMEYDAYLAKDEKNGRAKFYGGLAARAIDLAKLGRLYMYGGVWNGERLLSEEFVMACRQREKENGVWNYSNHFWLDTYEGEVPASEREDFFAGGFRGQIIYANPADSTIVVRLGKSEKGVRWGHTVSKLGLMPLTPDSPEQLDIDILAGIKGQYKNTKLNKFIDVVFKDGQLFLEGLKVDDPVLISKDTDYSYADKDKNYKVIVNYRDHQVKGLIVEGDTTATSIFFEKL